MTTTPKRETKTFREAVDQFNDARTQAVEAAKAVALHIPHPRWLRGSPAYRASSRLRVALAELRRAEREVGHYLDD